MKSLKKILALALIYVGAVIGAGFASGQELLYFFVQYGNFGIWGTFVAGIGFMIFGYWFFNMAAVRGIDSYHRLLPQLLGRKLGKIGDLTFSCYLFMGLVIMLAGCGAVFFNTFSLPNSWGIAFSSFILIVALLWKEEGILLINSLLVPLIILGALVIAFLTWQNTTSFYPIRGGILGVGWLGSSFLYVSYNLIGGLVILLRYTTTHRQEGLWGILLGGLILGVLAALLSKSLLNNYTLIMDEEVPLLTLAEGKGSFLGLLYSGVLWFAMLTSAIVDAGALSFRIKLRSVPFWLMALLLIVFAALLANIGFSVLIKTVYPFFGCVGIGLLVSVLAKNWLKII